MADLKEKSLSLLTSLAGVDYNNGSKSTIYTVPAGKSCVVHSIVVRNASASMGTNSVSYGFDANASNVIADSAYANLTGSTVYIAISSKNASTLGNAGDTFGIITNTTNTAGTVTIDVFGYLI